ncbi:hypothetical protein [Secundilactobacillus collinoides]|uniref:hypothetical protein n=1 Tax=Secundilactobacillus collinoides TaxID=33960 RepID=UPI0006CF9016|nr:hypothetical protein [Secundilactobacillus collinoides]
MSKYFLMFLTAVLLVTASTVVLKKSAIKTDADATHAARQTHQAAKPTLAHMSFGFKRGGKCRYTGHVSLGRSYSYVPNHG